MRKEYEVVNFNMSPARFLVAPPRPWGRGIYAAEAAGVKRPSRKNNKKRKNQDTS